MLLLSAPSTPELVIETDAHEGPVHVPSDHALYFTTARPGVAIPGSISARASSRRSAPTPTTPTAWRSAPTGG